MRRFSEYCAAFFAAAAGIYFLLRARKVPAARPVWVVWVAGQLGGLAIYGAMAYATYKTVQPQFARISAGYLRGAFPKAHENAVVFGVRSALKQFVYLFASVPLGLVASALFAVGLFVLWRTGCWRNRAFGVALVVPFVVGAVAAYARIYPFGASRQSVMLSLFIASGIGIALSRLLGNRTYIAGLIVVWCIVRSKMAMSISPAWKKREAMLAAASHLRSLPKGTIVLTEADAALPLGCYLSGGAHDSPRDGWGNYDRLAGAREQGRPFESVLGNVRLVWLQWHFSPDPKLFLDDVETVRRLYKIGPDTPLYVADAAWTIDVDTALRQRFPNLTLCDKRNFGGAVTVFRMPARIAGTSVE